MKAETIKNEIAFYDQNKGLFRIIKDEPHIKELRDFCNTRLEGIDTLTPALLIELAGILLGKNDRDSDSISSQIFRKLVRYFGGYPTLECLKKEGQLSEENITFLEKYHKQADLLAPLIVSIGKKLAPVYKQRMFYAAEMLSEKEKLLEMFTYFAKFAFNENADLYFEIIHFLNVHGINTDDVVPLLNNVKQLANIKHTLEIVLDRFNSQFNHNILVAIMKLQNPGYFYPILELLPNTPESLNHLIEVDGILDKCIGAEQILKNFKSAGWELAPYLNSILSIDRNGENLRQATDRLKDLPIKSELLPMILESVFTYPDKCVALVKAVALLNDENVRKDLLKIVFASKFPDRAAAAIVALRKENCLDKQTRNLVCAQSDYAVELAHAFVLFKQVNYTARAGFDALAQRPQCADKAVRVIDYLQKHSLLELLKAKSAPYKGTVKKASDLMITAVCKAGLTDDSLLKLFDTMKEVNLLNPLNLQKLMHQLKYIKTLSSATRCLANGNKLDQRNFENLIQDPANSLALAESLGGTPTSPSLPHEIDAGAKDFVEIRKAAKILAQGQRQGFFMPLPDSEKVKSFEKATHKKVSVMCKDTMIKIAEYTGGNHLEKNVVHQIANNAYCSVLK